MFHTTATLFPKRIYGLDIVRAFAILSVVFVHGIELLPSSQRAAAYYLAFDGVTVFFVLSGFLIGTILLKTLEREEATPRALFNFMYKRWFRTLPLYYLVLGFLALYNLLGKGISLKMVAKYALFSQNFNTPHPYFFQEAWSLAVEEWFYLLVPLWAFLLVGLAKIKPKQAMLLIIFSIIMTVPVIRYYKSYLVEIATFKDWDRALRKQVITRLDSIVFGLLGAYINFYYNRYWNKYKGMAFALGILLFLAVHVSQHFTDSNGGWDNEYYTVFSLSLSSLGVMLSLPFISNVREGKGYVYKFVTFVSFISYSMYLVNFVVVKDIILPHTLEYVFPTVQRAPYFTYALYWSYTISLSAMLYYFFEKPTLKLRDRLMSMSIITKVREKVNS